MIRMFLAEDQEVIREALRSLFEGERDLVVVGESGDGSETVELVEKLQPDILILDLIMPSLNGLEVARKVRKSSPDTRVVILSAHGDEMSVMKALKSGAIGFVKKPSNPDELICAIRKAILYEPFLCPTISGRLIHALLKSVDSDKLNSYKSLTNRELNLIRVAIEGYTKKSVREQM